MKRGDVKKVQIIKGNLKFFCTLFFSTYPGQIRQLFYGRPTLIKSHDNANQYIMHHSAKFITMCHAVLFTIELIKITVGKN